MMVVAIFIALFGGIFCGSFLFSDTVISFFSNYSEYVLYLLMFSVGISVGSNTTVFDKMKQHNIKILFIPIAIILGSIAGGGVAALLFNYPLKDSLCVVSGLGWYSLSGVLLAQIGTAQLGSIAFLSNLMREIFSFMLIPFLAKKFNGYTAIAPCAATSEDTTLPMLRKYANEEIVLIGVVNGIVCSAFCPILISFFDNIF